MSSRRLSALAAAALALAAGPALATSYAKLLTGDELVERAGTVVRGEVVSLEGRQTPQGLIETVVTIEVDEVYVGRAADTIEVVAPGGTAEGVRLDIEGAPRFEVGDDVVVFADGRRIVGFGQGAFVVRDGDRATRDLGNRLPQQPLELDLTRAFGQADAAASCLDTQLDAAHSDGWQLRMATGTRLGRTDLSTWKVNLLGGVEYKLEACTDALVKGARLVVTDEDGEPVAWTDSHRAPSLSYFPADSGVYYVGLMADGLDKDSIRGAAGLAVHFR